MGKRLFIQCNDCELSCEAMPIVSDMVALALRSDRPDFIRGAKKLLALKQVIVMCQIREKPVVINI